MLAFIALSLSASVPPDPSPPPEVVLADQAWNQCIQEGLDRTRRDTPVRAAARRIAADCDSVAQAMVAARTRWIEGSPLTDRDKRQAIRAAQARVTTMTRMLEMMIRASRDD